MPITALIIFSVSLIALVILFAVKAREATHPRVVRAGWRDHADEFALSVKWFFLVAEWYLTRLPLFAVVMSRRMVRRAALSFAHLAHLSATQAHRLADFFKWRTDAYG